MLTRVERAVIVGGVVLALVGLATRADAARSWASVPPLPPATAAAYTPTVPVQRVGLNCHHKEYLIWGVRYCTTLRARKVHGRWQLQPAAVIAGYNGQGRRSMRFAVAVRKGGRSVVAAGKVKRLVVRGRWRSVKGGADDTKAVFVIRFPNGRKSALKLTPHG